jgi:hypothetical protein
MIATLEGIPFRSVMPVGVFSDLKAFVQNFSDERQP